jgi:hypothetical protein
VYIFIFIYLCKLKIWIFEKPKDLHIIETLSLDYYVYVAKYVVNSFLKYCMTLSVSFGTYGRNWRLKPNKNFCVVKIDSVQMITYGAGAAQSIPNKERAGRSRVRIPAVERNFCLLKNTKIATTSTHPPIHGLPEALMSRLRSVVLYLHSPYMLSWRVHWQHTLWYIFVFISFYCNYICWIINWKWRGQEGGGSNLK